MIRRTDGWHEVKLLRVQTLQETTSVYVAEARDKDRFETLLRESPGFGNLAQREVLWIADGAAYNWNLQKRLCPKAKGLLDFYHAMEHVHAAARDLFGERDACAMLFAQRAKNLFLDYDAKEFFDELKECIPYKPKTKQAKRIEGILLHPLQYLWTHRRRMTPTHKLPPEF